jgi:Holliday junction resolvase
MLEKTVITKVQKYFKSTFKTSDLNKIHVSPLHNRGFPDLVVITDRRTFFIEVKAPGKKPTVLQRAKLNLIKTSAGDSGTKAYWVTYKKGEGLIFFDPEDDEIVWTVPG